MIFGLVLGCTYSLEELNQVQKIDRRAERTIQAGLKYSRDKLHSSNHFNLPLNGILELDPEQASYLAEWDPHSYQTNYLYEQYVNYIATDPDLFRDWGDYIGHPSMLCRHEIELNGVQSLDIHTAEVLNHVSSDGLELNGLTQIEPEVLHALTDMQAFHSLQLNGLTNFTAEHAKALTNFRTFELGNVSSLHLEGVTQLDLETLTVLKDINVTDIYFGLPEISSEQAELFAQFNTHIIHFVAVQQLPFEVAEKLVQAEWLQLHFTAVKSLDPETAELFHRWVEEGTDKKPAHWSRTVPRRKVSMAYIGSWTKFRRPLRRINHR